MSTTDYLNLSLIVAQSLFFNVVLPNQLGKLVSLETQTGSTSFLVVSDVYYVYIFPLVSSCILFRRGINEFVIAACPEKKKRYHCTVKLEI